MLNAAGFSCVLGVAGDGGPVLVLWACAVAIGVLLVLAIIVACQADLSRRRAEEHRKYSDLADLRLNVLLQVAKGELDHVPDSWFGAHVVDHGAPAFLDFAVQLVINRGALSRAERYANQLQEILKDYESRILGAAGEEIAARRGRLEEWVKLRRAEIRKEEDEGNEWQGGVCLGEKSGITSGTAAAKLILLEGATLRQGETGVEVVPRVSCPATTEELASPGSDRPVAMIDLKESPPKEAGSACLMLGIMGAAMDGSSLPWIVAIAWAAAAVWVSLRLDDWKQRARDAESATKREGSKADGMAVQLDIAQRRSRSLEATVAAAKAAFERMRPAWEFLGVTEDSNVEKSLAEMRRMGEAIYAATSAARPEGEEAAKDLTFYGLMAYGSRGAALLRQADTLRQERDKRTGGMPESEIKIRSERLFAWVALRRGETRLGSGRREDFAEGKALGEREGLSEAASAAVRILLDGATVDANGGIVPPADYKTMEAELPKPIAEQMADSPPKSVPGNQAALWLMLGVLGDTVVFPDASSMVAWGCGAFAAILLFLLWLSQRQSGRLAERATVAETRIVTLKKMIRGELAPTIPWPQESIVGEDFREAVKSLKLVLYTCSMVEKERDELSKSFAATSNSLSGAENWFLVASRILSGAQPIPSMDGVPEYAKNLVALVADVKGKADRADSNAAVANRLRHEQTRISRFALEGTGAARDEDSYETQKAFDWIAEQKSYRAAVDQLAPVIVSICKRAGITVNEGTNIHLELLQAIDRWVEQELAFRDEAHPIIAEALEGKSPGVEGLDDPRRMMFAATVHAINNLWTTIRAREAEVRDCEQTIRSQTLAIQNRQRGFDADMSNKNAEIETAGRLIHGMLDGHVVEQQASFPWVWGAKTKIEALFARVRQLEDVVDLLVPGNQPLDLKRKPGHGLLDEKTDRDRMDELELQANGTEKLLRNALTGAIDKTQYPCFRWAPAVVKMVWRLREQIKIDGKVSATVQAAVIEGEVGIAGNEAARAHLARILSIPDSKSNWDVICTTAGQMVNLATSAVKRVNDDHLAGLKASREAIEAAVRGEDKPSTECFEWVQPLCERIRQLRKPARLTEDEVDTRLRSMPAAALIPEGVLAYAERWRERIEGGEAVPGNHGKPWPVPPLRKLLVFEEIEGRTTVETGEFYSTASGTVRVKLSHGAMDVAPGMKVYRKVDPMGGIVDFREPVLSWSLARFIDDKYEWSKKTFGQGYRPEALIAHVRKELAEIESKPEDAIEWIDIVLLALDGLSRLGPTGEDIVKLLVMKQEANLNRKWPPISEQIPGVPVEHVRDLVDDAVAAAIESTDRMLADVNEHADHRPVKDSAVEQIKLLEDLRDKLSGDIAKFCDEASSLFDADSVMDFPSLLKTIEAVLNRKDVLEQQAVILRGSIPPVPLEDIEQNWSTFWKEILLKDGELDWDQLKKELSDFSRLMHSTSVVFDHVSGNAVSKCNTDPEVVKRLHDDHVTQLVDEQTKDLQEALEAYQAEDRAAAEQNSTEEAAALEQLSYVGTPGDGAPETLQLLKVPVADLQRVPEPVEGLVPMGDRVNAEMLAKIEQLENADVGKLVKRVESLERIEKDMIERDQKRVAKIKSLEDSNKRLTGELDYLRRVAECQVEGHDLPEERWNVESATSHVDAVLRGKRGRPVVKSMQEQGEAAMRGQPDLRNLSREIAYLEDGTFFEIERFTPQGGDQCPATFLVRNKRSASNRWDLWDPAGDARYFSMQEVSDYEFAKPIGVRQKANEVKAPDPMELMRPGRQAWCYGQEVRFLQIVGEHAWIERENGETDTVEPHKLKFKKPE